MEISNIQIPTLLTIKLSKNKIKPPMFLLTFLINIIEFDYCIAYRQYKYMIYLLILHFYFILLS